MLNWKSPYQQQKYNSALSSIGVKTEEVVTSKGKIFLNNLINKKMTAWEINSNLFPPKIKKNIYWKVNKLGNYENTIWSNDSYYTLVIRAKEDYVSGYSSANKRCIRKALSAGLKHRIIEPNAATFRRALKLFEERPETIEGMPINLFRNLAKILVLQGVADLHVVSLSEKICAAALVLKSQKVVNIRFLNSNKSTLSLRPMNLLYHSIIENYINSGFDFVDLSGAVGPNDLNNKLVSITRFKRGFTNQIVGFVKLE